MISFTWKIPQCDRRTSDGFITVAHWTATAVDGEYTAPAYSTCAFPDGVPATPYDEVTEADVLDWIWANGVDKAAVEASLTAQIALQKAPVQSSGTPWGSA
jgi:hypothetical protein